MTRKTTPKAKAKTKAKRPVRARKALTGRGSKSYPCPKCGRPTTVERTSLGARLVNANRDHVLRWRRCMGTARHRFLTEERAR